MGRYLDRKFRCCPYCAQSELSRQIEEHACTRWFVAVTLRQLGGRIAPICQRRQGEAVSTLTLLMNRSHAISGGAIARLAEGTPQVAAISTASTEDAARMGDHPVTSQHVARKNPIQESRPLSVDSSGTTGSVTISGALATTPLTVFDQSAH